MFLLISAGAAVVVVPVANSWITTLSRVPQPSPGGTKVGPGPNLPPGTAGSTACWTGRAGT